MCVCVFLLNKSLDSMRNVKSLINDWLAHQRNGVCTVQEYLASRSNEEHLMFDAQDEGGRSRAHPFLAEKGKLALFGPDYFEDSNSKVKSMMTFSDERKCFYTSYSRELK